MSDVWHVMADRVRAQALRLRGAKVSAKCRIGIRLCILHPRCLTMGERCHFEHDVYVKAKSDKCTIQLGSYVFVGRGVEFDVASRLTIGDHTLIAPGCFVTDHSHNCRAGTRIDAQGCKQAPVHIGNDVWLGAGVVVLAGVSIGDGAVVGAGAVVTRSVAPDSIVVGVPARQIGARA